MHLIAFVIAAFATIAGMAQAEAAQNCGAFVAAQDQIVAGMFTQQGQDVGEVHGFPLFATDRGLAYVACPLADIDGTEGTICRAGVLRGGDGVFRLESTVAIQGCQPADFWNPDCPDFTAEGFSQGNAANLALSLQRSAAQLCAPFDGDVGLTALAPADPAGQGPLGLDPATYFQISDGCTVADCDGATDPIGTIGIRAGARQLTCVVGREGDLSICRDQ